MLWKWCQPLGIVKNVSKYYNSFFCFVTGPDSRVSDIDGQPYTTVLYGNGPGFATPRIVPMNITSATEDRNQVNAAAVPRQWATHGGEDVPVYALGPLATTLFAGTRHIN